jgi:hypothetical protein
VPLAWAAADDAPTGDSGVGEYRVVELGGADVIVFTGGIGEMKIADLFTGRIYTISNLLSLSRILLVPLIGYLLHEEKSPGGTNNHIIAPRSLKNTAQSFLMKFNRL